MTEASNFIWYELMTPDPAGAARFYGAVVGWTIAADRDPAAGDVGLGAVMPLMDGYPVPVWNFYIGVDDIDRAHAAVKANGGTITNEPMEIPGGEYAMNAIDPQGAAVGFVGPRT